MRIVSDNPLMIIGFNEIVKKEDDNNIEHDWSIHDDRVGEKMIFYKDFPVDEIIYAVGEISLAMTTGLRGLQQEYYDAGSGGVFNIALSLVRDVELAKVFYLKYEVIKEKL